MIALGLFTKIYYMRTLTAGWLDNPFIKIVLIAWTAALYYHLSNGIRHLFWDAGKGFSLPAMRRSGWLVIMMTLALTAVTWNFFI